MKEKKLVKELVINIDMINGFVKEGPLAAPSIMRIVPYQKVLLDKFSNDPDKEIIFIRDEHTDDAVEFNTFAPHCIKGSKESELIDELKPYEDNSLTFTKNSTNFMFAPGFIKNLKLYTGLKKIYLTGCLSEICVKNGGITLRNYLDQENMNIEVYVVRDLIDTYDAPGHNNEEVTESAIKDMEANGIKVLKLGGILYE